MEGIFIQISSQSGAQ